VALHSLYCADVPLRNYSLAPLLTSQRLFSYIQIFVIFDLTISIEKGDASGACSPYRSFIITALIVVFRHCSSLADAGGACSVTAAGLPATVYTSP